MNECAHRETYRGHTIEVYQDDTPGDPRNWDNLSHMVCFHPCYKLGDQDHGLRPAMFADWDDARAHLIRTQGATLITPLYLLDHSGLWLRGGRGFRDCDPQGWDTTMVGLAYVTRRDIVHEYGENTPETCKKAAQVLKAEIEVYAQYIEGNVWGYIVKDSEGEPVDSCWGFFGPPDTAHGLLCTARDAIDSRITRELQQHARRVKRWIRGKVPLCYRTPAPVPYGV